MQIFFCSVVLTPQHYYGYAASNFLPRRAAIGTLWILLCHLLPRGILNSNITRQLQLCYLPSLLLIYIGSLRNKTNELVIVLNKKKVCGVTESLLTAASPTEVDDREGCVLIPPQPNRWTI